MNKKIIKTKARLRELKQILDNVLTALPLILASSLAIMLFFDFFLKTGLGVIQFVECVAIFFVIAEIKPYINALTIFR